MTVFHTRLLWQGPNKEKSYSRDAILSAEGKEDLKVSAAHPIGDAQRWNPEELLGGALANCHMLTFLALAHKVGIEVHHYEDNSETVVTSKEGKSRVSQIKLAPTIKLSASSDAQKAKEMFEKAHKYCIIANSVTSEVIMEPRFESDSHN